MVSTRFCNANCGAFDMVSTLVAVRNGIADFFTLNSLGGDFLGVNENFFTNAAVRPLLRDSFGVGSIGYELLVDGNSSDFFVGSSFKLSPIFDFFFKCKNFKTFALSFFLLGDFATTNACDGSEIESYDGSIAIDGFIDEDEAGIWSGVKMMDTGFILQLSLLLLFTKSITVSSDENDARAT